MDFKELIVYKKAFALAMEIFEVSKSFPKEEKHSLTVQIRKFSRSVCTNIAAAYREQLYLKHFIGRLTDADTENNGTIVLLDFSVSCNYLTKETHEKMVQEAIEISELLNDMMLHPEKIGMQK
jgi:four helix bundle protein